MKKLLYIIVLMAMVLGCSQENPGARYGGADGFAFGAPVLNLEVGSEEGTLLVPIYRTGFGVTSASVTCTYETGDGLADASVTSRRYRSASRPRTGWPPTRNTGSS